jgi:hypothetical protein
VEINDLCGCVDFVDDPVSSEAQEFDILIRIDSLSEQFTENTVLVPADPPVLPVHDDPGHDGIRVV